MTTDVQIPYIILHGNGVLTTFAFSFGFIENLDMYVIVDDVTFQEFTGYTISYDNNDRGGEIVFTEAPPDGSVVIIIRNTTYTQNVEYDNNVSFPAETHEWNLDKITYILQELLSGALKTIDENGNEIWLTFDLSVTAGELNVTINNSGGSNAVIPPWVSAQTAGVFHGEITDSAPADEAATSKADGYVWIETD